MIEVIWTDTALEDLEAIQVYVNESNPEAAERLVDVLVAAGNALNHFPLRGRRVPRTDPRELVATRLYVIRYFVEGDFVVILGIRHTARRPLNR